MNIEAYIDKIQKLEPLNFKSAYHVSHWLKESYYNDIIKDNLKNIFRDYSDGISRNDIINYLSNPNCSLLQGFLMTMIWGHGFSASEKSKSDNRGAWKVNEMLKDDFDNKIKLFEKVYECLLVNDIEEACKCFNEMKKIGISFYSKFLYFLGKAIGMKRYPLILDARVVKTIVHLNSIDSNLLSIVEFTPKEDSKSYQLYVNTIHKMSERFSIDADKIEFFLFLGIKQ